MPTILVPRVLTVIFSQPFLLLITLHINHIRSGHFLSIWSCTEFYNWHPHHGFLMDWFLRLSKWMVIVISEYWYCRISEWSNILVDFLDELKYHKIILIYPEFQNDPRSAPPSIKVTDPDPVINFSCIDFHRFSYFINHPKTFSPCHHIPHDRIPIGTKSCRATWARCKRHATRVYPAW